MCVLNYTVFGTVKCVLFVKMSSFQGVLTKEIPPYAHRLVVKVIKLPWQPPRALSAERSRARARPGVLLLPQSSADGLLGLPHQLIPPLGGHWNCVQHNAVMDIVRDTCTYMYVQKQPKPLALIECTCSTTHIHVCIMA